MHRARVAGLVAAAFAVSSAAFVPLTTTASASVASARVAVPSDLRLVATKYSLLGVHQWYAQIADGMPVLGGYYAVQTDRSGMATAAKSS